MNDDGTYTCIVCLFKSDFYRYGYYEYTRCHSGNDDFEISGKQLLDHREIITT